MIETLNLISLICFIASAAFLVLAMFFFFLFRIPSVIGDLSGRTARKSIAKNRRNNEKSGSKAYRPSETNVKRGKLTDSIAEQPGRNAGKKDAKAVSSKPELTFAQMDDRPETGLLNENRVNGAAVDEGATTELLDGTDYGDMEEGTVELKGYAAPSKPAARKGGVKLSMLDEVILVHTDEVIP